MGGGDLVDGATGRFGWGQSIGGVDVELELVDDRGDTGSCVVVVEIIGYSTEVAAKVLDMPRLPRQDRIIPRPKGCVT